jgi:hypothetical protein
VRQASVVAATLCIASQLAKTAYQLQQRCLACSLTTALLIVMRASLSAEQSEVRAAMLSPCCMGSRRERCSMTTLLVGALLLPLLGCQYRVAAAIAGPPMQRGSCSCRAASRCTPALNCTIALIVSLLLLTLAHWPPQALTRWLLNTPAQLVRCCCCCCAGCEGAGVLGPAGHFLQPILSTHSTFHSCRLVHQGLQDCVRVPIPHHSAVPSENLSVPGDALLHSVFCGGGVLTSDCLLTWTCCWLLQVLCSPLVPCA